MDTDTGYPIGQAIADTSHALAGELGLDANTVKRILSPRVLRKVPKEERHDVLQDLVVSHVWNQRDRGDGVLPWHLGHGNASW